jgi:hypothetical protein
MTMTNQRGRKPAAHLAIASNITTLETVKRPDPPAGMPEAEVAVWCCVTASLAADWFRPEQLPMLVQYCRHKVAADYIAGMISELRRPDQLEHGAKVFQVTYGELLKLQERETRTLATLATKMRITHQSTYDKSKRKPPVGRKPWESA